MSGLAVGFGSPNTEHIKKMMKKIRHRGPFCKGVAEVGKAAMGQNYLHAEISPHRNEDDFPIRADQTAHRICYDGQINQVDKLARQTGLTIVPAQEEKLLLQLYERHGADFLPHMNDAIFAMVISDGQKLLAARDLLGIKTLFYGRENGTLYFSSELKGLAAVTDDVNEFPAGHYMDESGELHAFAELREARNQSAERDVAQITEKVRRIISANVEKLVDFPVPTAGLLSGGLDSSVVNLLAADLSQKRFGPGARLRTYAIGVGESEDILNARVMAEHLKSDHRELIVSLDDVLEVLPQVIYYLENYDPSLVRSSVSNYLISRQAAKDGVEILLSGEGGDEIFCGYTYLKQFPLDELSTRQIECLKFLHNNASLRLDRMNLCNSVKVVAPLISGELLEYALELAPDLKQKPDGDGRIEKWIFRKAYEGLLPDSITWRLKQEFSQGSGSADVLPGYFEDKISDDELAEVQQKHPIVRSKEELYYFRLFTEHFGEGKAIATVGQWICL